MLDYIIIFVISLIHCVIGFYLEVLDGNLRHIENGHEPNAGACIFPTIPTVPLIFIAIGFVINLFPKNYGLSVILGYSAYALFFIYIPTYFKLKKEYKKH